MENEKNYFKRPTPEKFIKASLLTVTLIVILSISFLPAINFLGWLYTRSGHFVLFPECGDVAFYCVVVTFFLVQAYKRYQCLYFRMQEVPFLTLTKEGIRMDRAMVKFPRGFEWAGKIRLKWSDILRIEVGQDNLVMYFQENRIKKHEKVNLRWVEEIEMLLSTLEIECQNNGIAWIESKCK